MIGYFFSSTQMTASLDEAVKPLCDNKSRLFLFSNKSRDPLYPASSDDIGSAFQPLKRCLFEKIVIHASCDFFSSTMTLDWLANIVNSARQGAEIYLPRLDDGSARERNRITSSALTALLGEPVSQNGPWSIYRRPQDDLLVNHSVLGAFLQARGEFVLNALLGGALNNTSPERLLGMFAPILAPDAPPPKVIKRLPRPESVDIVNRVRAGELGDGRLAQQPAYTDPAPWNFTENATKFARHLNSWQGYLIPGTYYKAATIARIIEDHFGSDSPVSFLEHGGYAGTVSLQLLLEDRINVSYARCCELELFTLLNAMELHQRLPESIHGKFHIQITSAEEAGYSRSYDVILFSHVLLYMRRDLLDRILAAAWAHIRPGGIMIVFENTSPPTGAGGSDEAIIFSPQELDSYLDRLGELSYAESRTGATASRGDRETKPLFRVLRKLPAK